MHWTPISDIIVGAKVLCHAPGRINGKEGTIGGESYMPAVGRSPADKIVDVIFEDTDLGMQPVNLEWLEAA
jgi:hypothetical protein